MNRLAIDAQKRAAASGIMPLDYLLKVMRDDNADEAKRIDAAKAAAPYVHPKLQPIDDKGDTAQKLIAEVVFRGLNG